MADSLEEMFNSPGSAGFFSKLTDPFTLNNITNDTAANMYQGNGMVGGQTDALRHILASAVLARRYGPGYAKTITDLHESRLPFLGSMTQKPEDQEMDLYNNQLGIQLGQQATDYNDLVRKAQEYIAKGKARTINRQQTVQQPVQQRDYVDEAINGGVDLIRRMFSK